MIPLRVNRPIDFIRAAFEALHSARIKRLEGPPTPGADMEDELEPLGENEVYYDHEFDACEKPHDLTDAEIVFLVRKHWGDRQKFEMPDEATVKCRLADKHDGPHAQDVGGHWLVWDASGSRFDGTMNFCPYKPYEHSDCELPGGHLGPHPLSFW